MEEWPVHQEGSVNFVVGPGIEYRAGDSPDDPALNDPGPVATCTVSSPQLRARHFRLSFDTICRSELLRDVAGWLMAWDPGVVT